MPNFLKEIVRYRLLKNKFPTAQIAFSARVSMDSVLSQGVRVFEGARLGNCKVSQFTYIGIDSKFERTEIGPFTSVGPEVLCGLATHPLDFVTTYPGFYTSHASGATWFGANHDFIDMKSVQIGADVWIGARAVIVGGVNIGHGAVIGAGAIVTKDVPPYAIVVGMPAKVLRFRFDESIIARLVASHWWEAPESTLREVAQFADKPNDFLNQLEKLWSKTQLTS